MTHFALFHHRLPQWLRPVVLFAFVWILCHIGRFLSTQCCPCFLLAGDGFNGDCHPGRCPIRCTSALMRIGRRSRRIARGGWFTRKSAVPSARILPISRENLTIWRSWLRGRLGVGSERQPPKTDLDFRARTHGQTYRFCPRAPDNGRGFDRYDRSMGGRWQLVWGSGWRSAPHPATGGIPQ